MVRPSALALSSAISWTCRQCRTHKILSTAQPQWLQPTGPRRKFSIARFSSAEVQVRAAPEVDLDQSQSLPARILPRSPSYFTASPVFNDHLLMLQSLVKKHTSLPT